MMENVPKKAAEQKLTLDLSGLKCPLPALKLRKALSRIAAGVELHVICSDQMATIDIPNLVRETGDILVGQGRSAGVLQFHIRKT